MYIKYNKRKCNNILTWSNQIYRAITITLIYLLFDAIRILSEVYRKVLPSYFSHDISAIEDIIFYS